MFKGTVKFRARIKGNGLTFPLLDFNPNEAGVEKVEVEGRSGGEIESTVHLSSVDTHEAGKTIAAKVNMATLNRISFFHNVAIDEAKSTGDQFTPLHPQPGVFQVSAGHATFTGSPSSMVVGVPATIVKTELERATHPGEHLFSLFRSARQSMSPVEEFMTFYHILLMLLGDSQPSVDTFIISQEPTVPQTKRPSHGREVTDVPQTKHPSHGREVTETVYTRLRNELGHNRAGANLDNTKAEMENHLGPLRLLTKRAIELHS
jgi:hypothetical protein